nr:MAG TPA: hypothetical protein [Siphoviridae sp. ctEci12]
MKSVSLSSALPRLRTCQTVRIRSTLRLKSFGRCQRMKRLSTSSP